MKHIHIILEDHEFKDLIKIKGKSNWHDFILKLLDEAEADQE